MKQLHIMCTVFHSLFMLIYVKLLLLYVFVPNNIKKNIYQVGKVQFRPVLLIYPLINMDLLSTLKKTKEVI